MSLQMQITRDQVVNVQQHNELFDGFSKHNQTAPLRAELNNQINMNIFIKTLVGVSLLGGALFIAGCNSAPTGTSTEVVTNSNTATARPTGDKTEESGHDHSSHDHSGAMAGVTAHTNTTRLAFSSEPKAIPVGKPATWNLRVTNAKSGEAVNAFEVEMTKKMHLIVVKNDLSWFNHVHPQFEGDGKFSVTTEVPGAGTYKIYADYTVKGAGQEVPQAQFATEGQTVTPAKVAIAPDKMRGMWIVNRFNAHPESEPDARGGAVYEVALMPMPTPLKAGEATMLHFQIRDAKGVPIKDLQPYLGAMGHCVILSSDTDSYLHSHPMSENDEGMNHDMGNMKMDAPAPKSGGPDVMFHTNFPKAGLYKVWGQFQHKGKIITASYVVNVAPGKSKSGAAGSDSHAH